MNSNINQSIKTIIKVYPISQIKTISDVNLPYIRKSGKTNTNINETNANNIINKNIINPKKAKLNKRKSALEKRGQFLFSKVLNSEKTIKKEDSKKNKSVNNITDITNITNTNNKPNINRKLSLAKMNKINKSVIKDKSKLNKALFIAINDSSRKKKNTSLL